MIKPLPRKLYEDAKFYRQLKRPDEHVTFVGALSTALASGGWWLLAYHSVAHYSTFNRSLRDPLWWVSRILESIGRYLSAVIFKSEIMIDCEISGPVFFADNGYVIVGAKKLGGGTIIHSRVTIGIAVANGKQDRPVIGNDVWIGPDCVIAGGLHVGDGATILPGSCLTSSVPPRAVVKGNPARLICREFDNGAIRRSLTVMPEISTAAPMGPRCE